MELVLYYLDTRKKEQQKYKNEMSSIAQGIKCCRRSSVQPPTPKYAVPCPLGLQLLLEQDHSKHHLKASRLIFQPGRDVLGLKDISKAIGTCVLASEYSPKFVFLSRLADRPLYGILGYSAQQKQGKGLPQSFSMTVLFKMPLFPIFRNSNEPHHLCLYGSSCKHFLFFMHSKRGHHYFETRGMWNNKE